MMHQDLFVISIEFPYFYTCMNLSSLLIRKSTICLVKCVKKGGSIFRVADSALGTFSCVCVSTKICRIFWWGAKKFFSDSRGNRQANWNLGNFLYRTLFLYKILDTRT